jgi:hypothetical protein
MPARKRTPRPGDTVLIAGYPRTLRIKGTRQVKPKRCRNYRTEYLLSDGNWYMAEQFHRWWS